MSELTYHTPGELSEQDGAFNSRAWGQEDQDRNMEVVDWSEHHHFVTAEDDGETVGILSIDFKAGVGRITEVIVDKDFRGEGLGEGLMLECEKLARENDIHKLWLETRSEYEAAYALYQKLGYTEEAKIANYFNGQNYLIMTKDL